MSLELDSRNPAFDACECGAWREAHPALFCDQFRYSAWNTLDATEAWEVDREADRQYDYRTEEC